MSDNTVVYSYVRTNVPKNTHKLYPSGGTGVVCLKITRPEKEALGPLFDYSVNFSFCSPLDNFSKKLGRDRLNESYQKYTVNFVSNTRLSSREIAAKALREVKRFNNLPVWFKICDKIRFGKLSLSSPIHMKHFIKENLPSRSFQIQ